MKDSELDDNCTSVECEEPEFDLEVIDLNDIEAQMCSCSSGDDNPYSQA